MNMLGGDTAILWPAAIASLVCLGLNGGLLWYLYGLENNLLSRQHIAANAADLFPGYFAW